MAKKTPEKCQSHLLAHLCSFREGQQFLLACGPTPPAPKTVPVATRLVETIEAEGPTGNTVMLFGKVIDSQTGEEIPLAQVLPVGRQVMIESDGGKKRFGSPFAFSAWFTGRVKTVGLAVDLQATAS